MWGVSNKIQERCNYWPFADLLAAFYALASANKINWPLSEYDWHDFKLVVTAMDEVYRKLPLEHAAIIKDAYEWFLQAPVDWEHFGEENTPRTIPTDVFIRAQKAIEENINQ